MTITNGNAVRTVAIGEAHYIANVMPDEGISLGSLEENIETGEGAEKLLAQCDLKRLRGLEQKGVVELKEGVFVLTDLVSNGDYTIEQPCVDHMRCNNLLGDAGYAGDSISGDALRKDRGGLDVREIGATGGVSQPPLNYDFPVEGASDILTTASRGIPSGRINTFLELTNSGIQHKKGPYAPK
ncbi:MAG: hypothetical protein U9O94_04430 [Nanoarchaeota archaeon]|nr:hypothetical protein [Nanoarchaeota archaeon]